MDDRDKPEARHLRRLKVLEGNRQPWEDEWERVTRFALPRREGWDDKPSDDKGISKDVYDGEALASLTLMCDGLLGHLVPASIPFFKLKPAIEQLNDFQPLRTWLDKVELHLLQALERSNFYLTLGELFPDAGGLGTAVAYFEEDPGTGITYFSARHLKEIYIAENRWGIVDTVYRKFTMTLDQVQEQFGDNLGRELTERAEKDPDELVRVLHVVEPGERRNYDSTYILLDNTAKNESPILSQGGYDVFPYIVWRFRKNSDEVYGRSPAMDALHDIEMINHQAKSMAEAAHRAINPPLIATDGMRGKIRINPGDVTYVEGMSIGGQVASLYGGALGQYPLGIDAMERRAKIIRQHFRSDFFSYLLMDAVGSGRERTATEINAIEAQKAAVLGSTIGRITKELFEPVIKGMFQIEYAARRLPDVPREVERMMGMPLEIEYTGPLAQQQRRYLRSQGIMDGMAAAASIAQLDPTTLDNYDRDGISREASLANGLPMRYVIDPRFVQKIRKGRAEAQAAEQQAVLEMERSKAGLGPNKAPEPGSPADEAKKVRV